MQTVLMNGSPKKERSASACLLEELKELLAGSGGVAEVPLHGPWADCPDSLLLADSLVLIFPLYVDGIPSHLLRCLLRMDEMFRASGRETGVYGIINCGYYEGTRTELAMAQLENWCTRTGLHWRGGLGIGGGGMIEVISGMEPGKRLRKNVTEALRGLAGRIRTGEAGENQYITPNIPRMLYQKAAERQWRQMAKRNRVSREELSLKRGR